MLLKKRVGKSHQIYDPLWIENFKHVILTGESVQFRSQVDSLGRLFNISASRIGGVESQKVAILFTNIIKRRPMKDKDIVKYHGEQLELDL